MITAIPTAPHFGARAAKRTQLASLAFTLGLASLGMSACSAPHDSSEENTQHGETTSQTVRQPADQGRLAGSFTRSREILVDELNIAGSPAGVSNLQTDQSPDKPAPDQGSTAWDLGSHHYQVGWDVQRDTEDASKNSVQVTAEITDENGKTSSLQETRTIQDPEGIRHLTYTGTDGQASWVTGAQARQKAAQLVDSLITMSKAVSGEAYTADADWGPGWQTIAVASSTSPSASPNAEATEAPSTEATPSASPSETQTASPAPTDPAQPGGKAKKSFRLMSQNLWNIIHPPARVNWVSRMHTVVDIIRGNNPDLITTQEGSKPQIKLLKEQLGSDYHTFPKHYVSKRLLSERTIFYKAESSDGQPLWKLVDSGVLNMPNINDPGLDHPTRGMPWGRFIDARTGQEVVLIDIHVVAWDKHLDTGGALKRERSGHILADWANKMEEKFPNAVVVASGDFNDRDFIRYRPGPKIQNNDNVLNGDRSRLIPCILPAESDLVAIDDLESGHTKGCPPSNRRSDQAYSTGDGAHHVHFVYKGQSDHAALLGDVELNDP